MKKNELQQFIETDIENGTKYLRAALMNALASTKNPDFEKIALENIPTKLFIECMKQIEASSDSSGVGTICYKAIYKDIPIKIDYRPTTSIVIIYKK